MQEFKEKNRKNEMQEYFSGLVDGKKISPGRPGGNITIFYYFAKSINAIGLKFSAISFDII